MGARVRVDIPNETDSDYEYLAEYVEIVDIIEDDAGVTTGDGPDFYIYRMKLNPGEVIDLR